MSFRHPVGGGVRVETVNRILYSERDKLTNQKFDKKIDHVILFQILTTPLESGLDISL